MPVSPSVDGTFPTGTAQWEKRNIALEIPVWDTNTCIQCGKCSFVCQHAVIRQKVYDPKLLSGAPATFKSVDAKFKELPGMKFSIQVSPEDAPARVVRGSLPSKTRLIPALKPQHGSHPPIREQESATGLLLSIPELIALLPTHYCEKSQLLQPLFEFFGACGGCGETFIKLASQLLGDRMLWPSHVVPHLCANLPTTPWSQIKEAGSAWSNSLFEDNAEFGLGMRLTIDKQTEFAQELLHKFASQIGESLVNDLLNADQSTDAGIKAQRERIDTLKKKLAGVKDGLALQLIALADVLVKKSVWIIGGDGWAYDIGYGGLDHVLASGRNVNVLVVDTEVYSNTGGQASKATPRAAVAKFAARGKGLPKKDLGMIAMAYGYIYVARVAFGANDAQTLKAFMEADAYDGPSLIIAYSHCITMVLICAVV